MLNVVIAVFQSVLWSSPSPHPSEYLGMLDLDPAGDCDGDGIEDLAVGTGRVDLPWRHALVLSGADGTVVWSIVPETGVTGIEFARVGDVDGDGFEDIALGEPAYPLSPPCPGLGRVSVRSGMDGTIIFGLLGVQCLSGFGTGLESYPDVDGDGIRELVITAPYEVISPSLPGAGVARMYSGGLGPSGMPLWIQAYPWLLVPSIPGQTFPTIIEASRVGDLSGDGFPDLVFGGMDGGARVVSGLTGNLQYVLTILLFAPGGGVAPLQISGSWSIDGDLDGDGFADLVGSACPGTPWLGSLYFCAGAIAARSGANGFPLWWESPVTVADGLGSSVAGTADWDADGTPDIVIGRPGFGPGQVQVRTGSTGIPVFEFGPPPLSGAVGFGQSVCLVDDQNGDGLPEIGVSAPLTPVNGVSARILPCSC